VDFRLDGERQGHALLQRNGVVVPLEPVLGIEHANLEIRVEGNFVVGFIGDLESVLVIGETASVQESRSHFNHGLAITDDVSLDLDRLTAVAVDNGHDSSLGATLVTNGKRSRAINHTEPVGQVDELQEVAVNGIREDGLHDRLRWIERSVYV